MKCKRLKQLSLEIFLKFLFFLIQNSTFVANLFGPAALSDKGDVIDL